MLAGHDRPHPYPVTAARPGHQPWHWLTVIIGVVVLAAILALAWGAYHPGLSGDFLFDDFANLPALGATGPVDNWATFWRYITSGNADPTGRPLALLTFLLNAHNWPANPYPFKVTSVCLHLINGALLAWVLWWLGQALVDSKHSLSPISAPDSRQSVTRSSPSPVERGWPEGAGEGTGKPKGDSSVKHPHHAEWGPASGATRHPRSEAAAPPPASERWQPAVVIAALFGAGAWLLHPLLVSTTLYIVQREAMLPASFVLIAMLGWMASRDALARGHVKRALAGMAASAWLCTLLAVLSKANGALLPLLLLLVEWIVLVRRPMPDASTRRWYRRAVGVFLILPGALVLAYLVYLIPGAIHHTPVTRGWTLGQRLLTEPRVLTDYLRLLFVPHAHSTGLFNDQFAVSTDWLHPATTIPCMVLILALIGAGFAVRKKHPAIALALLFYFTAQLMESGWIPLELYYEHRNYLPAMLLFWPIGLALGRFGMLRSLRVAVAAGVLIAMGVLTWQRATLWGDGFRQAQVWAAINPDSARAQTNAALYDMHHHRPRLAAARLRLALPEHPHNLNAPINLIGAECQLGSVRPRTLAAAEDALAHTRLGGSAAFHWFNRALGMAGQHACTGLDFGALQATLDAAGRNPHWRGARGRQQDLHHLQGELDLAEARPHAALAEFKRALTVAPDPGAALQQAAYLGAHGYPALGLAELDHYATLPPGPKPRLGMPRVHAWVLRQQGWWPQEIAYLRKNLASAAAAKQNGSP